MVDLFATIIEFFSAIWSADKSLTENSTVGESEWDRQARRSWLRWGAGCLILLILAAVAAGASFGWWNG
ncbi:MAG TPA: hypothetical protein PLB55_20870 [Prosthecobacter sp.]|jgi:hypothetical protein|nr:hypothetical protein [Prosthecobacter sp.]